jgi:hypothetical protein
MPAVDQIPLVRSRLPALDQLLLVSPDCRLLLVTPGSLQTTGFCLATPDSFQIAGFD